MSERISAPGKVFLAGEYAVLEGWPALVVGVDQRMHATLRPAEGLYLVHKASGAAWSPPAPPPPELRFAARAATLARARDLRLIFEDDLALGEQKIGLGGSAAACVLAVRAARPQASDEEVLAIAAAAHWAEQGGQGSGADVAACALGGVLEVRSRPPWRSPEEVMALSPEEVPRFITARRVRATEELRLLLAFTGKSADTREMLASVKRDSWHAWHIIWAGMACTKLIKALEAADREGALQAVREGARWMSGLGVFTPELRRACELADFAGAAGKPSGAGGGDCAVVVAFGEAAMQRAEAALLPHFPVFRVSPA